MSVHTEQEAKTKWCPFARIGAACMAWRWDSLSSVADHDMRRGGCGLAGKPLL